MKNHLFALFGLLLFLIAPQAFAGESEAVAAVTLVNLLLENWDTVIAGLCQIVGGFAACAAIIPTFKGNKTLATITRIVDVLGANVGRAKNNPKDAVNLE